MKRYTIKVTYDTGDSFHTEEREDVIDGEYGWDNLDILKFNLKRIKEHYDWYSSLNSGWKDPVKEPDWHVSIPKPFGFGDTASIIILKTDEGNDFQFSAFWCGYFEHLHSAEIVTKDNRDSDWKVTM